jgi:hypothetical protein
MPIKTGPTNKTEAVEQERRRQRLLAFINRSGPVWRKQDYTTYVEAGAAEWAHTLRSEPNTRPMAYRTER